MTSCSYASASAITGVNSTKTLSFQPIVPLIAGSSLQVSMPNWFTTFTNGPVAYTCTGVTVA